MSRPEATLHQATRHEPPLHHVAGLHWLAVGIAAVLLATLSMAGFAQASTEPGPIELDSVRIDLEFSPEEFELPAATLREWVRTSALAVESYYERFPVERVSVTLVASPGKGVITGRTEAWDGARVRVQVGKRTDRADLARDWIMVHELVHLAFPSVPNQHHWIEEGLATYVEPLARLEIGQVPPDTVWHDLLDGLPKGLPRYGDKGLDFTPTWGRTYWGGALFCFLGELAIRKQTDNQKGLRDALRAILRAGGSMQVRWPLTRALEIADQEIGAPVLSELYEKMRASPAPVDLDEIFGDLGIRRDGRDLVYRDDAPLAATRRAIAPRGPAEATGDAAGIIPRKFDP